MLWLIALGVATAARLHGCKIWAAGPEPCFVFGVDLGENLYPLWALGYYFVAAALWVGPALLVWLLIKGFKGRL